MGLGVSWLGGGQRTVPAQPHPLRKGLSGEFPGAPEGFPPGGLCMARMPAPVSHHASDWSSCAGV